MFAVANIRNTQLYLLLLYTLIHYWLDSEQASSSSAAIRRPMLDNEAFSIHKAKICHIYQTKRVGVLVITVLYWVGGCCMYTIGFLYKHSNTEKRP